MTLPDSDLKAHRELRNRHEPALPEPTLAEKIMAHVTEYGSLVEQTALAARDGDLVKCSRLAREAGEELEEIERLVYAIEGNALEGEA